MELILAGIFVIGYIFITLEHSLHINKAAFALFIGALTWIVYITFSHSLIDFQSPEYKHFITDTPGATEKGFVLHQLSHFLSGVSEILFFLLGAMTIVELIDAHDGFSIITDKITTTSARRLLWIISLLAFFFSAVLDNLTTAIVMITVLRKVLADPKERMFFAGVVIIAANAGGAWSPIGDVTTTMLWIAGKITTVKTIEAVLLPSLVCLIVPLVYLTIKMKGSFDRPLNAAGHSHTHISSSEKKLVLLTGVGGLLFVPVLKTVTGLPPYIGMLFMLSVIWIVVELLHRRKDEIVREQSGVLAVIRRIDTPSILFFLGILIAIGSLEATGILHSVAATLSEAIGNQNIIVITIGLLSAVVDNVPLVAAGIGMYDFPVDDHFWQFLAYAAGTGGSCLIIGSAAGIAVMGMERIPFMWYLRKISLLALIGYLAGALVFISTYRFILT